MLGLLGGMSWESSIEYERLINQHIRTELGGTASADLLIRSFNFAQIEALQEQGLWAEAGTLLANAAKALEDAGAEGIVLCTNTMHVLAAEIEQAINVPFLHIADATGAAVTKAGLSRVLLLGTRYTMEKDFYKARLAAAFDLEVEVPNLDERDEIHRIIYEELVQGELNSSSKNFLVGLVRKYFDKGIQGVIAGCTEIELLLKPEDVAGHYFPTTALHAQMAAQFSLGRA